MLTSTSRTLASVLEAGSILTGAVSLEPAKDLSSVLRNRLVKYFQILGTDSDFNDRQGQDANALQFETAIQSLAVLERAQVILFQDIEKEKQAKGGSEAGGPAKQDDGEAPAHAMGTRDMGQLRTLLSLVFKWAIQPLLSRIISAISERQIGQINGASGVTSSSYDIDLLATQLHKLYALLYPSGAQGPISQTFISATLLNRHATDLLKPAIPIAWLPGSMQDAIHYSASDMAANTLRLLSSLPASQAITSLGTVLSTKPSLPGYARNRCSILLTQQLLRPYGINGLFAAVFGEEEGSEYDKDAPIERLLHVSKVLKTVPAGMSAQNYYSQMIPRIFAFLDSSSPRPVHPAYKRAAAFTVSRMLSEDESSHQQGIASSMLMSSLQEPLLHVTPQLSPESVSSESVNNLTPLKLTPSSAVAVITTILTNTDPSPTLIDRLLTPVIPSLYSLLEHLRRVRTSDPTTRESVDGLLKTWTRISSLNDTLEMLWKIVEGDRRIWDSNIAGELRIIEKPPEPLMSIAELLDPHGENDNADVDDNPLNLYPDPRHFVTFLKSISRDDLSSEVFARLLNSYKELKDEGDGADPMQTLLRLQLIIQIQNQLAEGSSSSNVLRKPSHILTFIKHALESSNAPKPQSPQTKSQNLGMRDLRILPETEEEEEEDVTMLDEGDSDDEDAPGLEGVARNEEMTVTAVNLLLSILEINPDLSARSEPILNDIFELLGPIAQNASDILRPLAREARLVMTARLASGSTPTKDKKNGNSEEEDSREIYQRALKLIQDPILPVRAHGLLLLRELVSPQTTKKGRMHMSTKDNKPTAPSVDPALIPAILSVFFESVQDEESYIFLNAVQGLSAMVDGFGKEILKGLMDAYTLGIGGVAGSVLGKKDVDTRVRVGEALGQIIRRCGEALPTYSDIIVPRLVTTIRASELPTTIRTSAISLLAQCAETSSIALIRYSTELTDTMIELLQIESVAARNLAAKQAIEEQAKGAKAAEESSANTPLSPLPKHEDDVHAPTNNKPRIVHVKPPSPLKKDPPAPKAPPPPATMDSEPTSSNSRFPPLRRAALHFLSLLLRSTTSQIYERAMPTALAFPSDLLRRARTVLGYVAATDPDSVVKIMARETMELLNAFEGAFLGL